MVRTHIVIFNEFERMNDTFTYLFVGTIADTEKDLTLVQFNEAFKSTLGLEHIQWDTLTYGQLLQTGASQARFSAFFEENGWPAGIQSESEKVEFAELMKRRKDDMFDLVWNRECIPALPGVLRLVDEAIKSGIKIAVCSNSNSVPVQKICRTLFGQERVEKILFFCGDHKEVGKLKKPDPRMYELAASAYGVMPQKCVSRSS